MNHPEPAADTFTKVVVPIDFSDDSLSALRRADRFASPEAMLILVHAVEPDDSYNELNELGRQATQTRLQDVQRRLQAFAASHRGLWGEVHAVVESGQPDEVIMTVARQWKADLVIMGAHGGRSINRTLFGGTTYQVARKLPCSVMVLRQERA